MSESQDAEITLGTGRLLAMFFGLVILCGAFFGLGFSLGRSSTKSAAEVVPAPTSTAGADKPSAAARAADTPTPTPAATTANSDLSFYKSVGQKDANPQLTPAAKEGPEKPAPPAETPKPAETSKTTSVAGGYVVQIAAVSKQEDADALVNALRKKQYPVFSTSAATDKLFHVQVGPFADIKDAEAMKTRLAGDGYNPILKK